MQKTCKAHGGKPKCSMQWREEELSCGEFEPQQTEGNFKQRLLQSPEQFKEDIDYRHFKHEEMTREGDEMKKYLEEIKGLKKKLRALHSNHRHS
ncbi:transcription elongation factor A protein-like 7 [Tupaia chinensis]|uniref:transcription elongation factor A protein-like 7 n=1 Tax=Tupaia chinensis TaxID=246437 RepID=UPI0007044E83|nr:transcription elongation factor A protein-like 7 [Tupaia chinensis]